MKPVWFWQCEDWIFVDENKNPITGTIGIGIKQIVLLIQRYKDYIGSHPHSVLKCRVSPYFRTMSPWL